jgi:hypothetical protein
MHNLNKETLDGIAVLRIKSADEIRKLAQHYLLPKKPTEQKDVGSPEFIRKMADSTAAVEVVCSLVNIFGVMANLRFFGSDMAIADLTFSLNTNVFWVKNANYLVPILNTSINAFMDNQTFLVIAQPLWDDLEYQSRNVWLEILPAIVFCLNGYSAMRSVSVEIKQSFEKFLRQ